MGLRANAGGPQSFGKPSSNTQLVNSNEICKTCLQSLVSTTESNNTTKNMNEKKKIMNVTPEFLRSDFSSYRKFIAMKTMTTTAISDKITNTLRSNSTPALTQAFIPGGSRVNSLSSSARPQTLNVHHLRETPTDQAQYFFGEVLNAWRAKARCNVVPADRTQELFHELNFNPSEKQIKEILQTVKILARKGSRQSNGLTFGEFCVLVADLKRFRTSTFSPSICEKVNFLSSLPNDQQQTTNNKKYKIYKRYKDKDGDKERRTENVIESKNKDEVKNDNDNEFSAILRRNPPQLRSTKSLSSVDECSQNIKKNSSDQTAPVEVFLGGSCNPTTWRADVAIPALKELGITFYNPQVSDWTPDLIELEHRAKEKAQVLFFVMDSETRASAGAIEAAHIAGQNCKQLVLVLHPYKRNQYILNEQISRQEYVDLMRNQLILNELVSRRGLPVLDNIPSGLQRTKEILAGIRNPPANIATVLVVVRGAFDRVNPVNDIINVEQCQCALSYLGYAQSLLNLDNLRNIILSQRDSLNLCKNKMGQKKWEKPVQEGQNKEKSTGHSSNLEIDFNSFCMISAYFSVLQQEIHESGCISPIKGTNVPPPPIYLTNMQGDDTFTISSYSSKNLSKTLSNTSCSHKNSEERVSINDRLGYSRDSGTSSPQPQQLESLNKSSNSKQKVPVLLNIENIETTEISTILNQSLYAKNWPCRLENNAVEEESDSNDSVFSSSSSINSVNYNHNDHLIIATTSISSLDVRDVYLGGSCYLRTKWRQNVAMPYLKSKKITFHLPSLHESLQMNQFNLLKKTLISPAADKSDQSEDKITDIYSQESLIQMFEKSENSNIRFEDDMCSEVLQPMRTNLYNPAILDASRVLLFVITNETRSLAPMTLAAHCIGLMYNVVLVVQMLPKDCIICNEKLTPAAIKDYNRGRSYLIDLAKRQGIPVFNDLKAALECIGEKINACNSRKRSD